jgi:tripartite-type tricarboxylate transporter receptor subunit TctC
MKSALVALLLLAGIGLQAHAENYPERPVKILVPYAPGGPVDQLARSLAQGLGRAMGQPVVVENKPGGNTIVAATQVARSKPDGYTLFMASSASLAVNPLVHRNMAYDPDKDFAPITMVGQTPLVLVVNNTVPVSNIKELTSYVKAREGNFAYASNGNGNPLHLACALFGNMANLDMLHVPFNGTAPALISVLANDTQMTCDIVLNSLPNIRAGKLKPLAIIGPSRVAVLPGVPTLGEQGMNGVDGAVWFALVAPSHTPPDVISTLNANVRKVLADPALKQRFAELAMDVNASAPDEVTRRTVAERAKWAVVVQKHRISAD